MRASRARRNKRSNSYQLDFTARELSQIQTVLRHIHPTPCASAPAVIHSRVFARTAFSRARGVTKCRNARDLTLRLPLCGTLSGLTCGERYDGRGVDRPHRDRVGRSVPLRGSQAHAPDHDLGRSSRDVPAAGPPAEGERTLHGVDAGAGPLAARRNSCRRSPPAPSRAAPRWSRSWTGSVSAAVRSAAAGRCGPWTPSPSRRPGPAGGTGRPLWRRRPAARRAAPVRRAAGRRPAEVRRGPNGRTAAPPPTTGTVARRSVHGTGAP